MPEKKSKPRHLVIGNKGEDLAADFLKTRNMSILERNWRPSSALPSGLRGLELDIVAREGDTLVFVEVKTRTSKGQGPFNPLDAYPAAKQAKLKKAVALYLGEKKAWEQPCRFDLVCVEVTDAGLGCRVELYQDALGGGEIF